MRIVSPFLFAASLTSSLVLCGSGCETTQAVDEGALARLKTAPKGSYLTGAPKGLGEPVVVNRRDFIYALGFDQSSHDMAFVHHVSTHMELTTTTIEPLAPVFQEKVNASEFDCEDVAFSASRVLVTSRQGTLRAFDRASGKLVTEVATGEPLLRVALSPDQSLVAVSSAEGRVLLFDAQGLSLVGEGKVHDDEVRGLAFHDDKLVSASQDGTVVISKLEPATSTIVRVPAASVSSGDRVFLTHVDGTRAIATTRDTRQPSSIINRSAIKRLQLASRTDGSTLSIMTAEGARDLPAIDVGVVHLRTLVLGGVAAAVCDDCLAPGVELLLGADVLARVALVEDVAKDEIVARPVDGDTTIKLATGARTVTKEQSIALPGPATDLDASTTGTVVVSFSADKAVRSFELHDKEKKGEFGAPSAKSGAAVVDVKAGALGRSFVNGHMGFTVTAALSPDGRTLATGGWDRRVLLWDMQSGVAVTERSYAWLVRRARFTPDGRLLGVAAWTPVNALNEGDSEPSLLLYPVALDGAAIASKQP